MRVNLTFVILLISLLQVSASGFGQRLTLKQENITLDKVFREIRKQTGYNVVLFTEQIKTSTKVSADFSNTELSEVMDKVLKGKQLSYQINEKTIVIKEKEASLMDDLKGKIATFFQQDSVVFRGKVVDETGKAMPGATVRVQGSNKITKTNSAGEFAVTAGRKGGLEVSYVGFSNSTVTLSGLNPNDLITVKMNPGQSELNEVKVVSTGYFNLPKERATGSFEVITAKQLQHSNDPNLLRRLEGISTILFNNNTQFTPTVISSSIITNRDRSSLADITIRGQNTFNLNTAGNYGNNNTSGLPLLVLDGVASNMDIRQINPDDVEEIQILKDAGAASVWGSRAANGVIVIKTKRGGLNQKPQVSFGTNWNIQDRPDYFYHPKMSVSDFIDAQRFYFLNANTNMSDPVIGTAQGGRGSGRNAVAEIMNDLVNRKVISQSEADAKLDALRGNDVRNDITKYLLRNAVNQNYNLGISGGSNITTYRISGGYSKSLANTIENSSDRYTLMYNGDFKPLKGLMISWNAGYASENRLNQGTFTTVPTDYRSYDPYERLADDNGQPLERYPYRKSWVDLFRSTYGNRVLDMSYIPLKEAALGSSNSRVQNFNLGANASYTISPSLSVSVIYTYNRQIQNDEQFYSKDSYYMRELINKFTDPSNFSRAIPIGDYYDPSRITSTQNNLQGRLSYNHTWNIKHALNAVAGIDAGQNYYNRNAMGSRYGYDTEDLTFSNPNYFNSYTLLYGDGFSTSARFPYTTPLMRYSRVRNLSGYANVAYTYNSRYTISASVRRDGSSVFGSDQNRSGTPFYSVGAGWNIANESFYHFDVLPTLQLRSTFGYNGNSNPATIPMAMISGYQTNGTTQLPIAPLSTAYVTNNNYRPERTGQLNLGLDFGFKNNRVTGSIEYYIKNTKDLVTSNALAPSTGFSSINYNTGDLRTSGFDLSLNSKNIQLGKFGWTSNFSLSNNRVKVTKLYVPGGLTASGVIFASTNTSKYNVGYDINRLFAYPWAGLDPQTGNPRVYLNGQALLIDATQQGVNNYNLFANGPVANARYMGSATPLYFGFLRNSFNYGAFGISANILYRFKYFSRRPTEDLALTGTLYRAGAQLQGAEYANRWQKPGDEAFTNVPSVNYPANAYRDDVYQYADINVIKADHIRLQEINLSYGINKIGWGIKNLRVSANVNNLGIIWRANKLGIDPDVFDVPRPRTYSFGLNANF